MFRETVASLGPLLLFLLVLLQQAGVPYPIMPLLIVAGALLTGGIIAWKDAGFGVDAVPEARSGLASTPLG